MSDSLRQGISYDELGPEYILEIYDPRLDFKGILVIDNTNLGVGKGGIRLTPTVNTVEVWRLARAMTYKNALAGLPFGGAKAGIIADPRKISQSRKKEIIQSFANFLKPLLVSRYIAGPDMNTTEVEMGWFSQAVKNRQAATGKPKNLGGLPHELGSTGYGVALATKVCAEHLNSSLADLKISIAGYGNVGQFAHKFLEDWGATIIAVSDSSGTVYNRGGLKYATLMEIKQKTGSVLKYPGAKQLSRDIIYELTTDVLIPAAGPDVIHEKNISKIKAQAIVEGANIPMAAELENRLHKRNVLVVPDIIANAGGVISSYAEYKGFNEKKMFKLIEDKIVPNVREILQLAAKQHHAPRDAALKIAKARILARKK